MNLGKTCLAGLALLALLVASCTPGHISTLKTDRSGRPRTARANTPQPVPPWIMAELTKAGFREGLFSRATFICSNDEHKDEPHVTKDLKKVKEWSKQPPAGKGCAHWKFTGTISKDRRKVR